ncbi:MULTISPECIES: VTT domain-containing protein [unclassified Brenneria]|uniref:DedA family protein n=1 Tax=unclassified Brenneria TaxID=2634434 RepID=UPI0029C4B52C|nr:MULTISPECIES: VTT domain-containing protein [unclassified Brenneria]MDX5627563.1 VTT domain-containing protein [Brenneria sp. L3-3Z]MDX5694281.1 VTT domain-containing protein [Brenneria sp. L4-2C]MEE3662136.1 VTT domain-containing protein [Brenneria sp. g21c3]
MFELQTIEGLIAQHGLLLLTPLAVLEGPIVTVIAAYLARLDYFNLTAVCIVVILADLVGDLGFYALGRWAIKADGVPPRWLSRFGLSQARLQKMGSNFETRGGKILAFGKLTHSAGAAVLLAAGMARMRLRPFLFYNTLATIPKSLFFVAIGYAFGHFAAQVDDWIAVTSLVLLVLLLAGGMVWLKRSK